MQFISQKIFLQRYSINLLSEFLLRVEVLIGSPNDIYIYLEMLLLQLVDFESWKNILSRSEKNSGNISNEGAICVLPNALEARHLDIQGNIYAFGVLLLEIVSGRPPYCEDKGCLVDWVRK